MIINILLFIIICIVAILSLKRNLLELKSNVLFPKLTVLAKHI